MPSNRASKPSFADVALITPRTPYTFTSSAVMPANEPQLTVDTTATYGRPRGWQGLAHLATRGRPPPAA